NVECAHHAGNLGVVHRTSDPNIWFSSKFRHVCLPEIDGADECDRAFGERTGNFENQLRARPIVMQSSSISDHRVRPVFGKWMRVHGAVRYSLESLHINTVEDDLYIVNELPRFICKPF